MNKIILLCIAAVIFAGCSKSDTNNKTTTTASLLTGKWIITADTLNEYTNGTLTETQPFNVTSADYFQFNADGSGSNNVAEGTVFVVDYNYKLSSQTITFNYLANSSGPAYSQNATIKQLTSTKLIILFDDSNTSNGSTGADEEIVYMTKQ